jgi:hypothetical protein
MELLTNIKTTCVPESAMLDKETVECYIGGVGG